MDVSLLPDSVLQTLVEYLSVMDVLHCSMVSSTWREAFNNDRYWKIFCLRRHQHSLYDYLRDKPCLVEPAFKVPDEEYSMLPAPCKWKVDYVRARHLERNIEEGRYTFFQIKDPKEHIGFDYVDKGSDGDIIHLYDAQGSELWNVSGKPFLLQKFQLNLQHFPNFQTLFFTLTNDQQMLVICQLNVLQIYQYSDQDTILKHKILLGLIDEGNDTYFKQGDVFGHLFAGVYMRYHGVYYFTLCLWNLVTGRKEKQIHLGNSPILRPGNEPVISILHRNSTESIVIRADYTCIYNENYGVEIPTSALFKYNFVSGQNMCVSHIANLLCVINKDLVVTHMPIIRGLQFYDISTENPTLLKTVPNLIFHSYFVHEPYIMLSKSSHEGRKTIATITTIHTKTFEVLSSFNQEFNGFSGYVTFDACNDSIMIIRCGIKVKVWNWKKQLMLYSINTADLEEYTSLQRNVHFTHLYRPIKYPRKYCRYSSVGVYHFW